MSDNTRAWLRSAIGTAIAGGASSVASAFSANIIDPKDFSLGGGGFFKMMGGTFVIHSIVSLAMYLQKSPLPDKVEGGQQAKSASAGG